MRIVLYQEQSISDPKFVENFFKLFYTLTEIDETVDLSKYYE